MKKISIIIFLIILTFSIISYSKNKDNKKYGVIVSNLTCRFEFENELIEKNIHLLSDVFEFCNKHSLNKEIIITQSIKDVKQICPSKSLILFNDPVLLEDYNKESLINQIKDKFSGDLNYNYLNINLKKSYCK